MGLSIQGKINYSNTRKQRINFIKSERLHMFDRITYADLVRMHQFYAQDISEKDFAKYYLDISLDVYQKLSKDPKKKCEILRREPITEDDIKRIFEKVKKILEGSSVKTINYEQMQLLYQEYGEMLDLKTFAFEILGIKERELSKLKEGKNVEVYKEKAIPRKQIRKMQTDIIQNEKIHIDDMLTMQDIERLWKKNRNGLTLKDFATMVLQISLSQYYKLQKGTGEKARVLEQYYVLPEEIEALREMVVKNENLKIGQSITQNKFAELYSRYAGALSEQMFAVEILGMTQNGLKNMRLLNSESQVLTDVDIPAEVKLKMVKKHHLRKGQRISFDMIRKYNEAYAPELNERLFAIYCLGVETDCYKELREKNNTVEIFKGEYVERLAEPIDFKNLRRRVIKEEKLLYKGLINYSTFQQIHQKYEPDLNEEEFAKEVLDIGKKSFEDMKTNPEFQTTILMNEPLLKGNQLKRLRELIIEEYGVYKNDKITYAKFELIYIKYGGIYDQSLFAQSVLGIDAQAFLEMKDDSQKLCSVFEHIQITREEKRDIKERIKKDRIKFSRENVSLIEVFEIYKKYPSMMTIKEFAISVLGISKDCYQNALDQIYIEPKEIQKCLRNGMTVIEMSEYFKLPQEIIIYVVERFQQQEKKSAETLNLHKTEKQLSGKEPKTNLKQKCEEILNKAIVNDSDKKKLRQYIKECFERFAQKEFKEEELEFLENCLYEINLKGNDIVTFTRMCVSFGRISTANSFLSYTLDNQRMDGYMRNQIIKLQVAMKQADKKIRAVDLIARGNTDINTISRQTQLPISLINEIYKKMQDGTFDKDRDVFPETPDF